MSNYYHTYRIQYLECPECAPREKFGQVYFTVKGKAWVSYDERGIDDDSFGNGTRRYCSKELGIKVGDTTTWVCAHGQLCRATIVGNVRWEGPFQISKQLRARILLGSGEFSTSKEITP